MVNIIATDPGEGASGINQIYYGITGQCVAGNIKTCVINKQCIRSNLKACTAYGQPFTLSSEGIYNIVAYSQDVAGNFSIPATDAVRLDQTPPVTVASVQGGFLLARVVLSATDKLSGVLRTFDQLDGGPIVTYDTPILVTKAGTHTLKFWSEDNAFNNEQLETLTFTVRR